MRTLKVPAKHYLLFFACLLIAASNGNASEKNGTENLTIKPKHEQAREIEIDNLALFEFLGSFETPDGQWINPMEIETMLEQSSKKEVSNE